MELDPGPLPQPADVGQQAFEGRPATDGGQGRRQGRLDADLELKGVGRDLLEQFQGRLIEQVGADFEVQVAPPVLLEDEGEEFPGAGRVVVEGAVDELDLRYPLGQ